MMIARLEGGPADGMTVERSVRGSAAINVVGEGVDEGHVARYTPTRDKAVYRFRGLAKVLATMPAPGGGDEPVPRP